MSVPLSAFIPGAMDAYTCKLCCQVAANSVAGFTSGIGHHNTGGSRTIVKTIHDAPTAAERHVWPQGRGRTTGSTSADLVPDQVTEPYIDAVRACALYMTADPTHELLTKLAMYCRYYIEPGFDYTLMPMEKPGTFTFKNGVETVQLVTSLVCTAISPDNRTLDIKLKYNLTRDGVNIAGGAPDGIKQGAWLALGTASMVLPIIGLCIACAWSVDKVKMSRVRSYGAQGQWSAYNAAILNHYNSTLNIQGMKAWFDYKTATSSTERFNHYSFATSQAEYTLRQHIQSHIDSINDIPEMLKYFKDFILNVVSLRDARRATGIAAFEVCDRIDTLLKNMREWSVFYRDTDGRGVTYEPTPLLGRIVGPVALYHIDPNLIKCIAERVINQLVTIIVGKKMDPSKIQLVMPRRSQRSQYDPLEGPDGLHAVFSLLLHQKLQELKHTQQLGNSRSQAKSFTALLLQHYSDTDTFTNLTPPVQPPPNVTLKTDAARRVHIAKTVLPLIDQYVDWVDTDNDKQYRVNGAIECAVQAVCCNINLHLAELLYIAPTYCCVYCFEQVHTMVEQNEVLQIKDSFPFLLDVHNKVKPILNVSQQGFDAGLPQPAKDAWKKLVDTKNPSPDTQVQLPGAMGGSKGPGPGVDSLLATGLVALTLVVAAIPR